MGGCSIVKKEYMRNGVNIVFLTVFAKGIAFGKEKPSFKKI